MKKKILGLDLGTNSIGWAVINGEQTEENLILTNIEAAGSRIIPMDAATLSDFNKGNTISQTKERTQFRGIRRLRERELLRRERLNRVLDILNFLPQHYAQNLNRYGQLQLDCDAKIPWKPTETGKYQFLFQESFYEMLEDFRTYQPNLIENSKLIPYDWTIYYLRKKALTAKIEKEELAWILLNFNQKRGYYQLRGEEEEEQSGKRVEFIEQKVVKVEATNEKRKDEIWYNIHLENGMIYRRTSKTPLDWEGKTKEFIVTTDLEKDGTPKKDKEGNIKRSFRAPKEDDWTLLKKKTEYDIDNSHKTVGCYIYDTLLQNPNQKIKGKLIRTIERKYYKEELEKILKTQEKFHPELQNKVLYNKCLEALYVNNESRRKELSQKKFVHLFINDIIFYQRPLKSKKSLIDDCPFETRIFTQNGEKIEKPIKCIAKSNPYYQEFRIWQFISNLRIYERERNINQQTAFDVNVTNEYLKNSEDFVRLFKWLNERKEVEMKDFFKKKTGFLPLDTKKFRWNYVEDKKYPCNETRDTISKQWKKAELKNELTSEIEFEIWHILYSIEDKEELRKACQTFVRKHNLPEKSAETLSKTTPFKKDYGAYSEKAIKRLLPLMRIGELWNEEKIDSYTKKRIEKILTGEFDEKIATRVREKAKKLEHITDFQGLPLWLATYIVYNRHSEAKEINKWESPDDIDNYLRNFKQHSLRNPIVEQVVTETLRTVRDIWKQVGTIDEIHVELGREMKNSADARRRITQKIQQNENTNMRIKAMLREFINPEMGVENVRAYSPSQQEILRIYEENALENLNKDDKDYDFIDKISKMAEPSKQDILRYKCWLEQKYQSPYTGKIIPLSKLFTPAYEIEHIIPQSRYFDDSFSNKVICESAVNKLKDNKLGLEFIKKHKGQKVEIGNETVEIFTEEAYLDFVKKHFSGAKLKKLLMDDIPDDFINRQLNDSRYISKMIMGLLSNIVREEDEAETTSKNLIPCNGSITDKLKKDWGVNDIWNRIILPRFQRMNTITESNKYTTLNANGHIIPCVPIELQKGFTPKRIDHRHHAMDAIVIACTTRNHVNLLNNQNANSKNTETWHKLSHKLRKIGYRNENGSQKPFYQEFLKPWDTFPTDVENTLQNIIVSFKQNLRVINKTSNHYTHYENGKKVLTKQTKGDNWAIRKSLHKDTIYGEINLRKQKEVNLKKALENVDTLVNRDFKLKIKELLALNYTAKQIQKYFEDNTEVWNDINLKKIPIYYFTQETKDRYFATRKPLDNSFDKKKIEDSIADTGIQKILLAHLEQNGNNPEIAFSPDGIDAMNKNIITLNNGKQHKPIYHVRIYEKAEKFSIGATGQKAKKFVEADKGTNLFFAIYEKENIDKKTGLTTRERNYETISFQTALNNMKQGVPIAPCDSNGNPLAFILSPNDLVYVPTPHEQTSGIVPHLIDKTRIYKMVSATGKQCCFIPYYFANVIEDKKELFSLNKMERSLDGIMIKEVCVPLKTDRIGNIISINGQEI